MNRREFVQQNLCGAAALSVLASQEIGSLGADPSPPGAPRPAAGGTGKAVTAQNVHDYLRSLGAAWVDPKKTVDTFKAGDPNAVVQGIAVGWMSYFESLRKARELGCNLFVTHEPTYYDHFDRDASVFAFDTARQKKAFLERNGMAVIRCHDVWDRVPEIGIRDAWARFLGLEKEIGAGSTADRSKGTSFCAVYEIAPVRAGEFARKVAGKVASLGQDAVLFVGPEDKIVRSVAIGTGAGTPLRHMVKDLKADLAICTDDSFSFWQDGSLAIDMGYPVIVLNHPCSEEIGIKRLAEHLAEKFRQVPVHHIPQTCMFKCLRASSA